MKKNDLKEVVASLVDDYNRNVLIEKFATNIHDDNLSDVFRLPKDAGKYPESDIRDTEKRLDIIKGFTEMELKHIAIKILTKGGINEIPKKFNEVTPFFLSKEMGVWNAAMMIYTDFSKDWNVFNMKTKKTNPFANFIEPVDNDSDNDRIMFFLQYGRRKRPLFLIPHKNIKKIKNKIIIYDRDHMSWRYKKFKNEHLDRKERLIVKIEKNNGDEKIFSMGTASELDFDSEFVKIINIKP